MIAVLVGELAREGTIERDGAVVRLAGHRVPLSEGTRALWQKLQALHKANALRPPTVAELAVCLGQDVRKVESVLSSLERQGLVVRVAKSRFFLPAGVARLRQLAEEEAGASGGIRAAASRDRTGIGRGVAIEVLECFDRIRFTRRVGDMHVLVRASHGKDTHPGGAPGPQIQ